MKIERDSNGGKLLIATLWEHFTRIHEDDNLVSAERIIHPIGGPNYSVTIKRIKP